MNSLGKRRSVLNSIKSIRRISNSFISEKKTIPKLFLSCSKCNEILDYDRLIENYKVCSKCNNHMEMEGNERLNYLLDKGYEKLTYHSKILDPISFPKYEEKRRREREKTGLKEAITMAKGKIKNLPIYVAIIEPSYLMGSLGTFVGEELTKLFENATIEKLPVLVISASGGARMQEGIFSLMQMAKTVAVIEKFSREKLLYISMLTNPTMGGVSASFASIGDIIIAEPDALIGFAGPRVIEQTMKQNLPEDFQKAEKLMDCGFIDIICDRKDQREVLYKILKIHNCVTKIR